MNLLVIALKKLLGIKRATSEQYLNSLKQKGIKIGEGTVAFVPSNILVDVTRPELIEIGDNVFLHNGTRILSHDLASWCFVNKYNDFVPSHGKVKIGNNVWFGENVTVLKGVTIGDNVIIGAGSIVNKPIPSNTVAAGTPCRPICTIDEYYQKRKKQYVDECINYAISIIETGRKPTREDFYDDYTLFVDARNYKEYNYPYNRVFKKKHQFEEWLKNHKATYNGFEEFMEDVYKRINTNE